MTKRTIKVKFTDVVENTSRNCYGETNERNSNKLYIRELLKRMYHLDEHSEPDYVFTYVPSAQCKGFEYGRYKNAVIIFLQGENVFPDFFCFDYSIGSDPMLKYGGRYFYYPSMLSSPYTAQFYDKMLKKHENVLDDMASRGFCAMTVSNGDNAARERERFFHMLSQYKTVESGGRFLNNIGGPVKDKFLFETAHKFTIAFDNVENGMVQEKIGMAFAAQTVPIYWGNPNVKTIYNEKAFINCHAYDSFEQVVDAVRRIDQDDSTYLSMLREPVFIGSEKTWAQWEDELCEFLRGIIEQPKEKAIKRRTENWMGIMQEMRLDGFRRLYKKRRSQAIRVRCLKMLYAPIKRFVPDNELTVKIRRKVLKAMGL